jgi:hypothetical protein
MLIASMIVVTWLCETQRSRAAARTGQAAFVKVAPRRS